LWRRAEVEVFGRVGLALRESDCLETTGLRIDEVTAHWFAKRPWEGPSPGEVARQILSRVIELITHEGQAKEDAARAVHFARSWGVPVALVSSSPYALLEAAQARLGIVGCFDVVHSAEDEALGKPHPGVYLRAAERLGVAPRSCVAMEDSLNGVIAAKAARMRCVAVPEAEHQHDPRFVLADVRLSSLRGFDAALLDRLARPSP
jgi:sugar-phosphatase